MYAILGTQPDITYAVGAVSLYNSNPRRQHWNAVKRIFRYLKGTMDFTLEYKDSNNTFIRYSDADWGDNLNDRRSTGGYTFLIAGGSVTWSSKKQPTVALSSTETEYIALTQAAKEAIWIRHLLKEVKCDLSNNKLTIIYNDNQRSNSLSKDSVYHTRTKHIDIQHHFIREKVENKEVEVIYCRTEDMIADYLTKGISKKKH